MESTAILRRFNRSYTQRIGALDESFLGLGLPLGGARLEQIRLHKSGLCQLRKLGDGGVRALVPDMGVEHHARARPGKGPGDGKPDPVARSGYTNRALIHIYTRNEVS